MIKDTYIKGIASGGGGGGSVGAKTLKTGQTISYRTGDDGDLEDGRATDFLTLGGNNPFGNTNRFTDELGGATYTNNIVIDWSTYDGSTVLGIMKNDNGTNINWADSIDAAIILSIGTFTSGWRIPNIYELFSFYYWGGTRAFDYTPFNDLSNTLFWTSTSNPPNPMRMHNQLATPLQQAGATSLYRYKAVRNFTVTGTTLT
jgi:hypothetical protein